MIKRILVTGGAGFLGSYLCERLVEQGHDVICLDNFFTSQKTNVTHLLSRPNFELVRHDVTLPIFLEVDEIFNLACPAAPGHYQFNPIKTIKTSVLGAINMLGLAKRCNARILQASTSEVYGDPEQHPQTESYRGNVNPIGPRACYDEGKRIAETLFMDYHRMNRVRVRVVRIFNTYGPRMHPYDGRVVSNFIRQAVEGQPITIFGEGSQTRSFCYRDDLVDGIIRMMNGPEDFIGPVNIGNPVEFTIRELAEQVIAMTGSKSPLVQRPLPADDPVRRQPDITLARRNLDGNRRPHSASGYGRRSSGSVRFASKTIVHRPPIFRRGNLEKASASMRIWIDADAAPREVKELVFRTSTRLKLPVVLVANQSAWTPPGHSLITCVTVRSGANIADKYIVDHAMAGDLAITADIPLAAQLVEKQVFVIDPRGEEYDDRNVFSRLAARDLFDAARGAGMEFSGPAPYSVKDRIAFAATLDRVLTRALKSKKNDFTTG